MFSLTFHQQLTYKCNFKRSYYFYFSIVYGALLTKTNRIYRIFNASKKSAQRPGLISPKSQLTICAGIVLIQVIINIIWMLVSPPEAINHHPTREDRLLVCKVCILKSTSVKKTNRKILRL